MIQVIIVDDDPFIRESLKMILELDPELSVPGTFAGSDAAHAYVTGGGQADVALMDIRMPGCSGVEGTLRIKQTSPATRVLILTTFDDDEYIVDALRNGASGYLLKNIPPERIVQGIKAVHQGDWLIHPDIARKLTGWIQPEARPVNPSPEHDTIQAGAGVQDQAQASPAGEARAAAGRHSSRLQPYGLTATELQVVEHIAEGRSNKEIAQDMFLSEGTVKNYVTDILSKLGVRDRTQIAIMYWRDGERR
ncbi:MULTISPECIES: response regulator transcription factor [unclassified Paenibacillus]|uniref:response regulator transcription factor n=1 Tax=unclassified Paenibacillus TaxID=185978 RepID=UPI0009315BD6|nr:MULTISPECIES: response regulator transcription factor [unclassified Paenibacillus]